MAGWVRYGEERKYKKEADTNVNPKHVGDSLRTLTLEDRLELRRQARELQKKRALQAAELDDDDEAGEDLDNAEVSSGPSLKKAKSVDEVEDLTVTDGVAVQRSEDTGVSQRCEGQTGDDVVAVVVPANGNNGGNNARALTRTTSNRSATSETVVVELDDEDAAAAALAARRIRRRASSNNSLPAKTLTKLPSAPAVDANVQVLE